MSGDHVTLVEAFAPGRVNLIGDHTDHTGGLVLPMAVAEGVTVAGERGGDRVVLRSDAYAEPADLPLSIDEPAAVEPAWARLVAGVVAELRPDRGLRGVMTSTLPIGSGMSSSAAVCVATALALGADPSDPVALASLCQRAEQRALGVPCGIMDQLASVAGREGRAVLIDTESCTWEEIALPAAVEVRVVDSGRPRTLVGSGYAEVRDRCVRARDVLGDLVAAEPDAWRRIEQPDVATAARHVIGENRRVREFARAVALGDVVAAGHLMVESHRSLGELGVSTPALDALVARLTETPGVFGARLTGAGFGGWVVVLSEPGTVTEGRRVVPSDGARVTAG